MIMEQTYIDYLKKYEFKHPIEYGKFKVLTTVLQEDLEMDRDTSDNILNHIYNHDENKKSKYNLLLRKWSSLYSLDKQYLKDKQNVLKSYKHHQNKMDDFINDYVDFKREQNFLSKYQYVQFSRFQNLNKIVPFLQVLALYNFCSPLFSLLAPIFGLIIPYFVLYMKGFHLGFSQYISVIKNIIKNQYIIKGVLNFTKNSLQSNIYLTTSIFFYFMSIYNNIISCVQFYKNSEFMITFTENYNQFLTQGRDLIDNIHKCTGKRKSFGEFNKVMMMHRNKISNMKLQLNNICECKDKLTKYSIIGFLLKCNFDIYHEKEYDETVGFLIYLNNYNNDMYNISNLLKKEHLNLCRFKQSIKPEIRGGYYLPHILQNNVTNDIDLKKNIIITGPNASGKTTVIKSTLINLFLSQSVGCGCYSSCKTQLYDYYHSYLNIPDTSNRDSLFQAEARRCKEIIVFIEKNKTKKHFCIFDEIYSGTNPSDAVLCATIYLDGMNEYKNSVDYVLTTHYIDMCEKLEKNEHNSNKMMVVNKDPNGKLQYEYKLVDGISRINGGYQILEQLEYPEHLLK
uniref:DNA mismatch repair proteins mutS family domain-containing protein n=1 Tax=viral metagenome TaxID=1070528 RepID=A0A6C0L0U7_9ZZZZ|tara:strand:- start:14704 stop:16404 length:1701 start_codon:yes stop_codon:yes gene_type:complete